jgi:Domain of unknown function (DUF6484)
MRTMKSRSQARKEIEIDRTATVLREVRARRASVPITSGRLVGVGPQGEPWIDVPTEGLAAVVARSTVPLTEDKVGREVLVMFPGRSLDEPVVVGVLRQASDGREPAPRSRLDAVVDGQRIVLSGEKEIVLRCGKASIALSADGTVVIKGARLLAAASGVHRIKGGTVQIN